MRGRYIKSYALKPHTKTCTCVNPVAHEDAYRRSTSVVLTHEEISLIVRALLLIPTAEPEAAELAKRLRRDT